MLCGEYYGELKKILVAKKLCPVNHGEKFGDIIQPFLHPNQY